MEISGNTCSLLNYKLYLNNNGLPEEKSMQQGNTKERIVEAYIELESERPVEKITVTALVERSRITRKTFYYYFKDIYDLMEYRMEREMKRVMEETMSQPDPEKALTQLYMYIMENQKHIRALSESVQFMALRRQMGEKVYQYFYNHLERIGMFKNHGSSSGSPAQGKRQRVWDVHCDGGGVVSLFLCGGKAGSDSENTSDDGILHRDQSSVFVGAFENGGNHLYCRICLRDLQGCRVRFAGNTD